MAAPSVPPPWEDLRGTRLWPLWSLGRPERPPGALPPVAEGRFENSFVVCGCVRLRLRVLLCCRVRAVPARFTRRVWVCVRTLGRSDLERPSSFVSSCSLLPISTSPAAEERRRSFVAVGREKESFLNSPNVLRGRKMACSCELGRGDVHGDWRRWCDVLYCVP
jgi:hypothetical protein